MVKLEICNIDRLTVEDYERTYAAMHASRREKTDRLRIEDDKKRSLAGEFLARKLLSGETGKTFEEIQIVADENGKPYSPGVQLHFSISHSEKLVAAAVCDVGVGVDCERIHNVSPRLFKRACTDKELFYIFGRVPCDEDFERQPENDELVRFFEIWTVKEAYFKCIGTGITALKSIDIFSGELDAKKYIQDDYIIHTVTLK